MRAQAGQLAVVQHQNHIRMADGAGALRHDEHRHRPVQRAQRLAQRRVGRVVQRRGAVVQNQNLRPPHQRAGDGQALALAAGEIASALFHHFVQTAGLGAHHLGGLRGLQRAPKVLVRGGEIPPAQVVSDGSLKQHRLLRHHGDFLPEGFGALLPDIHAVHQHAPRRNVVKAGYQVDQRGFARARAADDAHGLPRDPPQS